jgi:hypothetical protein
MATISGGCRETRWSSSGPGGWNDFTARLAIARRSILLAQMMPDLISDLDGGNAFGGFCLAAHLRQLAAAHGRAAAISHRRTACNVLEELSGVSSTASWRYSTTRACFTRIGPTPVPITISTKPRCGRRCTCSWKTRNGGRLIRSARIGLQQPGKDDDGERFQIVFIDGQKRAQRHGYFMSTRGPMTEADVRTFLEQGNTQSGDIEAMFRLARLSERRERSSARRQSLHAGRNRADACARFCGHRRAGSTPA